MGIPSIQDNFENILETEIDRREFLAYCGATLLGVFGISSVIKALTQAPSSKTKNNIPGGYGSSTYGGKS